MKSALYLAAACLALSACSGESPSRNVAGEGAGAGWRIAPAGDLNQFFDCLEAQRREHCFPPIAAAMRRAARRTRLRPWPRCLKQAPALMEIDVVTSADGVLYLMHDDTLERTTNGAGEVDALSWAEISRLKLEGPDGERSDFSPPQFADVLRWAAGRTVLQVDIKRSTRYEDLIREIKDQDAEDRVILIAYSVGAAKKLHRLAPKAMISLNLESQSEINRAVAEGLPADRLLGFTGIETPRPRLFSTLASSDIEVIFGTLGGRNSIDAQIARTGDEDIYAELSADGVDIIATGRPAEAHKALAAAGRAPASGECGIAYSAE